jgi:hypothetical protein
MATYGMSSIYSHKMFFGHLAVCQFQFHPTVSSHVAKLSDQRDVREAGQAGIQAANSMQVNEEHCF